MSGFELPTNIKQVGSIGEGLRIYIEDYVITYLQQYAEAGGYDERIALLLGRYMVIDNQNILFISGTVQGKNAKKENGILTFSEDSRQYRDDQIKKHFAGLEPVGWVYSQPSYGINLNASAEKYHAQIFNEANRILFVMDPIEKVNVFFVWDDEEKALKETRGYFIFYDKNHAMHEYMLNNKINNSKIKDNLAKENEEQIAEPEKVEGEKKPEDNSQAAYMRLREKLKNSGTRGRYPYHQRRTVNMLATLSAVLFLICFIMGAGLIQNDDRISTMENQLTQLNTAYRDLLVQVREDGTQSVFAATEPRPAEVITVDGNELLSQSTPQPTVTPAQFPTSTPAPTPEPTPVPDDEAQAVTTSAQRPAAPPVYTVVEGDTLEGISRRFYGNRSMIQKIMELNGMEDPDMLISGKKIKLP